MTAPNRTGLMLLRNPARSSGKAHRRNPREDLTGTTLCGHWARDMIEVPASQVADEDRCGRCDKHHARRTPGGDA